jgi:FimV-like protein
VIRSAPRVLALALALAAPALAQQPAQGPPPINDHVYLPEANWNRLPQTAVGRKFYVMGRWKECWNNQVQLHKFETSPAFFIAGNEELRLALVDNGLPNQPDALTKGRTPVRLFGQVGAFENRLVLMISRVEILPDDAARLQQAVTAAASDADRLAVVAQEAFELGTKFEDQTLLQLHRTVKLQELEVRRQRLTSVREYAALAEQYRQLGDRLSAITLLDHVFKNATDDLKRTAQTQLEALQAVQTAAGWVPIEAFKAEEGFVQRGGAWVRKEMAELTDIMEKELAERRGAMVEARSNPVQHGNNASANRLERGQTLEEARLAAGNTSPVFVYHVRAPDETQRMALWTQWVLSDGRRAYFMGREGETPVCIAVRLANQPLPTQ